MQVNTYIIVLVSVEANELDAVFKALADPTRRLLLDRLREQNGQTLGELCDRVSMARQSATQHLDILVRANLVTVVRRGRERLHYLNPAPIHEIDQRWIAVFDRPRLDALRDIKSRAESINRHQAQESIMTVESVSTAGASTETVPNYVYATYIRATAEQVWQALTDADLTARYWGHAAVSEWTPDSPWELRPAGGSEQVKVVGRVLETNPPTRLVVTFDDRPDLASTREPSVVTFDIAQHQDIVRLTVTHENFPNGDMRQGISNGWPAVLANLKSLLETGDVLPQAPWDMPRAQA